MSQIVKALKKAQESRIENSAPLAEGIIIGSQMNKEKEAANRTRNLIVFLAVGMVVLLLMNMAFFMVMMKGAESGQNKVSTLEDSIRKQDKKINGLIGLISKSNTLSGRQITAMKLRFANENKALEGRIDGRIGGRIDSLASEQKGRYDHLKEAILDDKQEISYLDNLTKKIEQQIEAISASNTQVQGVSTPSNG